MANVSMGIEFTEMKGNTKHQNLKFTFKGEDEEKIGHQLYAMRGICVLHIEGCEVERFYADHYEHKGDHNGFVSQFRIKGDVSDEDASKIYRLKGRSVNLRVETAQMSMEDFYKKDSKGAAKEEPREGKRGKIHGDGTVDVDRDPNQSELDLEDKQETDELPEIE